MVRYRALLLSLLLIGRCFAECDTCFPFDEAPCTPWKVAVGADFLYFRAVEDGLIVGNIFNLGVAPREGSSNVSVVQPIAAPYTENGVTIALSPVQQQALKLRPSFAKGYRVGLEVQPPESKINLYLSYSYYKTSDQKNWVAVAAPNPFAPPFLVNSFIDEHVNIFDGITPEVFAIPGGLNRTSVTAFFDLKIQEYQLFFSYDLNYKECFLFKPYVGVKGVLIDQVLNFDHNYGFSSLVESTSYFETSHQRLRFFGFGLEGGMKAEWTLKNGLFSFGNLGIALVTGRQQFESKSEYIDFLPDDTIFEGTVYSNNSPTVLKCCFESSFGFGYRTPQFWNLVRGIVRIGFENHTYFKQNFFAKVFDIDSFGKANSVNGDLSTYGIKVSGELVF